MRAVVTKVASASVSVEGTVCGAIETGFLVLLGITHTDDAALAEKLADKISSLRIFEDAEGKTGRSLADVAGSLLVVSQFTLYGNCKKGRRPEFLSAAGGEQAEPLYRAFVARCRANGFPTQTGAFGAYMQVSSVNDGPFTLMLDTDAL